MNAHRLVTALLENEIDPKEFLNTRMDDYACTTPEKFPVHHGIADRAGGTRRKGKGYSDQWEIPYKNWLFIASVYDDGSQIWSAHYKAPAFSWSTRKEQKQGWAWSGGGDPVKLLPGQDPNAYLARLKLMADKTPDPWKIRHIPHMPHPDGPQQYRGNY